MKSVGVVLAVYHVWYTASIRTFFLVYVALIDQKILHCHFRMIRISRQYQIPELPCQLLRLRFFSSSPPPAYSMHAARELAASPAIQLEIAA